MSEIPPTRSVLTYETSAPPDGKPTGPRPVWVYVVAGAYVLILCGLLLLPTVFGIFADFEEGAVATAGGYVCILLLCGFTMILAPVRARRRRPITRRSIWFPILGSAAMMALLVLAFAMTMGEWMRVDVSERVYLALTAAVWLAWAVVFGMISMTADPTTLAGRLNQLVLAGSALELLVAVPAHLVVRRRSDCCAGMATGAGLCIGATVMLVAFGPSVFVLYYKRWKRVRPRPAENG
jgi:hypothetical protein